LRPSMSSAASRKFIFGSCNLFWIRLMACRTDLQN